MNILDIIEAKKKGSVLSTEQIRFAVDGFTGGSVERYQMSALLMAIWFRGMDLEETTALTGAMLESGEQLKLDGLSAPTADKHSTGGVGDKVSLLLAPLAAACGLKVPMLSGRGLGHTGGTLDKLEAVPGYRIHLENDEFLDIVEKVGCSVIGQSGSIAPADGRIYALRDVTGTVDCVPLITASIMSKKLAAGPQTIVIDLKTGSGAFMSDLDQARELAAALVSVGKSYGRRMSVIFSDMGQPLGRAVGHANETLEAFRALMPTGRDAAPADLVELTEVLVAEMVHRAGLEPDLEAATERVRKAWVSGDAWSCLETWIEAHGGVIDPDREDLGLKIHPVRAEVQAPVSGFLAGTDCRRLGLAMADVGGARRKVEDPLDLAAGYDFLPMVGDRIEQGKVVARIHAADEAMATAAARSILDALVITPEPAAAVSLVLDRLS